MQGAALEEVVELDLLKTAGRADALLVARGHVAGGRLAFRLRFRAFEDDDFAWHKMGEQSGSFLAEVKRLIAAASGSRCRRGVILVAVVIHLAISLC